MLEVKPRGSENDGAMVAGFLATAILMPFAAAHLSVTWALAAWIVYGVALVLADRATDDRATSIRWSDWGVALVARGGRVLRSMAFGTLDAFSYERVAPNRGSIVLVTGARRFVITSRTDLRATDVDAEIDDDSLRRLHDTLCEHVRIHVSDPPLPHGDRVPRGSWVVLVVGFAAWAALAALGWSGTAWERTLTGFLGLAQLLSLGGIFVMARFFVRARSALRHAWTARGSTRWRLVSVGTDAVRIAREGRELEAHAVLEDPRSSGGPGADLGRVSADVLCRSPIDETAYRASAPLVFPDALRARPTLVVATIGMLLALPMMAPALAVRLVPATALLRR